MREKSNKYISILDYKIFAKSKSECLDELLKYDKVHVVSGNPEVLYTALNDEELLNNFMSNNTVIIPDGVGTQISAQLLKSPVEEKIAGIELMKDIIKYCEENDESIYLLGASDESLEACIKKLKEEYPKLKIAGFRNGFFNTDSVSDIVEEINKSNPLALFVAMGCPRQEKFIIKNMDKLPAKIYMGVGGSFDVIGDKVKRAPRWMISIGMEWFYRVAKEPWRIKRLGSIPKFLLLVMKNRGNGCERE